MPQNFNHPRNNFNKPVAITAGLSLALGMAACSSPKNETVETPTVSASATPSNSEHSTPSETPQASPTDYATLVPEGPVDPTPEIVTVTPSPSFEAEAAHEAIDLAPYIATSPELLSELPVTEKNDIWNTIALGDPTTGRDSFEEFTADFYKHSTETPPAEQSSGNSPDDILKHGRDKIGYVFTFEQAEEGTFNREQLLAIVLKDGMNSDAWGHWKSVSSQKFPGFLNSGKVAAVNSDYPSFGRSLGLVDSGYNANGQFGVDIIPEKTAIRGEGQPLTFIYIESKQTNPAGAEVYSGNWLPVR